jgi:hypothetical protein
MFDLKTILAVNALGNGSYHALAVRVDLSRRCWSGSPFRSQLCSQLRETHATKAFSRRVALYARDANVSHETARLVIQLRDLEHARGDSLNAA